MAKTDTYEYAVKRAGFFYGVHRKELDRIMLTAAQAKYEIMAGNLYERGHEPWTREAVTLVADAAASAASSASLLGIGRPRNKRRVIEG